MKDMKDIVEVADSIYRLETPIITAQYPAVAYIIKSPLVVVIDPGTASNIPMLRDAMKKLGIDKPSYFIPTHLHMDHAGSAGTLARLYPEAKFVVHPRYARHAINPSRLIEAFRIVWGQHFEETYGEVEPVSEDRLLLPKDGDVIDVGDRQLQVIYALGHAPHHIAIYDRKSRGLFCGEALGLPDFQLPAAPPNSFDLDSYSATIEKLRGMKPGAELVFFAHGGVERDFDVIAARALDNIRVYADMVLKGLKKGESQESMEQMVAADMKRRYGVHVPQRGLYVTVAGLTAYFKSKGMVS
jgi:glyoxylase-like metal-dependent hydrolase (beta-lactamase superfamily II)